LAEARDQLADVRENRGADRSDIEVAFAERDNML
jgi:hypothetical protein